MIPLKESLEMFYILRVALKRRCKDAFFGGGVDSCIARTTFLLFFPSPPSPSKLNNECFNLQQTTQPL